MSEMRHIISLGAGVQSSTMALMAAHGEITPMPEFAIFADTGWEPPDVMEWLSWLSSPNVLPFPVVTVKNDSRADLWERETSTRKSAKSGDIYRTGAIPTFVLDRHGNPTPFARKCTEDYKLLPIRRYLESVRNGEHIVQWLGISTDEASRMKPAREDWRTSRFPLVMEHRMARSDCLLWMDRHGYPRPPRSACIFCPLHGQDEWRRLRDEQPESFQMAVSLERQIHEAHKECDTPNSVPFLHRQRVPLDQVDFDSDEDRGQRDWINECEGMCGV